MTKKVWEQKCATKMMQVRLFEVQKEKNSFHLTNIVQHVVATY